MPRGEHLDQVRPSKERRLALLGCEALMPGEVSVMVRVRLPHDLAGRFQALQTKARGAVIAAGLEALEVRDAEAYE